MRRSKKDRLAGLLIVFLLVIIAFLAVLAIQQSKNITGRAGFGGFGKKDAFDWQSFQKSPQWQSFSQRPEVSSLKKSRQWQTLVKSEPYQSMLKSQTFKGLKQSEKLKKVLLSPSLTAVKQSPAYKVLQQSPQFKRVNDEVRQRGSFGGFWALKNLSSSAAFKNFFRSSETKAFLSGAELKDFVGSAELRDFVKSREFKNFVKSSQFEQALQSPLFKRVVEALLGQGSLKTPLSDMFDIDLGQLGLDSVLADLLNTLLDSLLGGGLGIPQAGKAEVVASDANGNPTVVRLGLPTDSQGSLFSFFSLYAYLIKGNQGVVVWNYGVTYPMGTAFDALTFNDLLALLTGDFDLIKLMGKIGERCQDPASLPPHLSTSEMTIETVDKYFPGEKIAEIDIGHWHIDHSEDAPRLQQKAFEKWGFRPPIRIHQKDRLFPDADGSPGGAEQVFKDACFLDGSWQWGEDLKDGQYLAGTSFKILHTGCHTYGMTNVVSDQEKLGIYDFFPPGFALSPTGGGGQGELDPLTELIFSLFEPLGDAFWGALSPVMKEDPDMCGVGSLKYYNQAVARGYPTYYVHFTDIVKAEDFPPPTPTGPATTAAPPKPACLKATGDANCDGRVDLADFEIWRKEYLGQLNTQTADFNEDKKVDLFDFETWLKNLLKNLPPWPQASPTPSPTRQPSPTPTLTPTPTPTPSLTGNWNMMINIKSPQNYQTILPASLSQESGKVTGHLDLADGTEANLTGALSGNTLTINPTVVTFVANGIKVTANITLNGTISQDFNKIEGVVTGNIISPINSPLSGTFIATRL